MVTKQADESWVGVSSPPIKKSHVLGLTTGSGLQVMGFVVELIEINKNVPTLMTLAFCVRRC